MKLKLLEWFGFGMPSELAGGAHGEGGSHGHTHGVIDASLTTTEEGLWAIKWSFIILAITAAFQLAIVFVSGSVALLADTIHNIGDATTAIPLWAAFVLSRRKPSSTFTYGLGRVEDLAGILIVLIILASAIVAGYEAIDRLIHPQPIAQLGWLAAAGIAGFVGNEVVAVFRIRVGRRMNSAALIADGYHARTDGLTSLAVVLGALGVWLGYPVADSIIGLLITVAILGIVWQSARAVLTRALDGVDPQITAEIRHAAEHVQGVTAITEVKARWLGHELHADVAIKVDPATSFAEAKAIVGSVRNELVSHLAALRSVNVTFEPSSVAGARTAAAHAGHGGHHAPAPFKFDSELGAGTVAIVDTPAGERMRLVLQQNVPGLRASVSISRPGGPSEFLPLERAKDVAGVMESVNAPAEPHEFRAVLRLAVGDKHEQLAFEMVEPEGHAH